jgi:proteasome lid subunit RPN8/RPN11
MLQITAGAFEAMLAHALDGLPDEACGLFAGPFSPDPDTARCTVFYGMRNAAASSQIYQLDGREMMDVEATADAAGLALLGVMHSHTHTTAYPSPTDVRDAGEFDPFGAMRFVIVSLRHPEPALRSFRMADGTISEEAVEVVED